MEAKPSFGWFWAWLIMGLIALSIRYFDGQKTDRYLGQPRGQDQARIFETHYYEGESGSISNGRQQKPQPYYRYDYEFWYDDQRFTGRTGRFYLNSLSYGDPVAVVFNLNEPERSRLAMDQPGKGWLSLAFIWGFFLAAIWTLGVNLIRLMVQADRANEP